MPRGIKAVRRRLASGEVVAYHYHRPTGKRLNHDPASAEGLLEIAALDGRAKALKAAQEASTATLAGLWRAYTESPQWRALRPRTRSDYQAVWEWLGEASSAARVRGVTRAQIQKLQDKAAAARGRRFANYVVQVLRLVLEWGRDRGWIEVNPAMGMKLIRRPSDARILNRAWTEPEVRAFLAAASPQVALPFALAVFAGMRQGDALNVTWSAYSGQTLRWKASKNGELCEAPVTGAFRQMLEAAKARRGRAVQIAVTGEGTPWTASGYRASFRRVVSALTKTGQIGEGCTFHGARHTIGAMARQAQESDWRVAAAIGDRSTKMAEVYGRDADRKAAQTDVLAALQDRFGNTEWKTAPGKVENASPRRGRKVAQVIEK